MRRAILAGICLALAACSPGERTRTTEVTEPAAVRPVGGEDGSPLTKPAPKIEMH